MGTAAQDPRTAPCLILDFEGGSLTLEGMPGEYEIVPIRTWDDYSEVYNDRPLDNTEGWKSVGIDSLSETRIFALLTIVKRDAARRKNPDLIEQGDYGTAMVQMRRLIREFKDLPEMHTIFLSSSKDVKDPRDGMVKKPALSGQLADDIPGMMDFSGYLALLPEVDEDGDETGGVTRTLILQNEPRVRARSRAPWGVVLPDEIHNPTMTSILDTFGIA